MSKVEEFAIKKYPVSIEDIHGHKVDVNLWQRKACVDGYHQAERDIKEELSNLFQEFMLDCINDDTETHILHFIDVFNNKIKTIGNE